MNPETTWWRAGLRIIGPISSCQYGANFAGPVRSSVADPRTRFGFGLPCLLRPDELRPKRIGGALPRFVLVDSAALVLMERTGGFVIDDDIGSVIPDLEPRLRHFLDRRPEEGRKPRQILRRDDHDSRPRAAYSAMGAGEDESGPIIIRLPSEQLLFVLSQGKLEGSLQPGDARFRSAALHWICSAQRT